MGKIWLVICENEELARVREEILDRDARARFLRFDDTDSLMDMARAFKGELIGVAFCRRALSDVVLEEAVRNAAREGFAQDILVFSSTPETPFIARLFSAGATEVIAAGDAALSDGSEMRFRTCVGEEAQPCRKPGAPAGDDEEPCADEVYGEASYADHDDPPWDVPVPAEDGAQGAVPVEAPEGSAADACKSEPAVPRPQDSGALRREAAPWRDMSARSDSDGSGAADSEKGPRAPLVAVISGRGGCGKTTIVAAMAACAARAGLRTAVLDFDLMFGNLYTVLGAPGFKGFEGVSAHADADGLAESDIEGSAMRIGPGLTLWGPCEEPERAELMTESAERLISTLRGIADVIFVDTSVQWGDTVAMAVGACDRCLLVGSAGASVVGSTKRAMDLAAKLGVPATRMTSVFNRMGARGCGEDQAMHFEIGVSLRSRVRIPDGGEEVSGMLSFGQVDRLVAGSSPFAKSLRLFTCETLKELGCPVNGWLLEEENRLATEGDHTKLRLPWKQKTGELR